MAIHPNLIFKGKYQVQAYDIDSKKELTILALIRYMQESAMQNVIRLKVSVWDLESQKVSWILRKMEFKIDRNLRLGEVFQVTTHPAGFDRLFTYRDYRIHDEEGEEIASAASTWLLLDTQTRKMAPLPKGITQFEMLPESSCLPRPSFRLPKFTKAIFTKEFEVGWFDLDFNHHLNNLTYIRWMLETLSSDWHQIHELKGLNIIYRAECFYEEIIISETLSLDNHCFLHRLYRKSDQTILCEAETTWERAS